jgi:hypothetical protein
MPKPDLQFQNNGSLFVLLAGTPAGQEWVDENVGGDETMTWGGGIVVEPRYVDAIAEGAMADGLLVQ